MTFDYDSEHRITRIYEGALNYASAFSYHPSGAVLAYTSGNGVVNTLTYDPQRDWPTWIRATLGSSTMRTTTMSATCARSPTRVWDTRKGLRMTRSIA